MKNKLHRLLQKETIEKVPPAILLASEFVEEKVYARLGRSHFHHAAKYYCYDFYKPISTIVKPQE